MIPGPRICVSAPRVTMWEAYKTKKGERREKREASYFLIWRRDERGLEDPLAQFLHCVTLKDGDEILCALPLDFDRVECHRQRRG